MKQYGVDVSIYQGDFNFTLAKSEGVTFAVIKGGGGDDGLYVDKKFTRNYTAAKAAGLLVGAYWFSKALTVADAKKEAEYFYTNCLKGRQFELPIYMDVENKTQLAVGKQLLTDIIKAWCDTIKAKGYLAGIYSSVSMFRDYMYDASLSSYPHWIAQWASQCAYTGECGIWQFSGGTKKVAGISCDEDYLLIDYTTQIKKDGLNGYTKGGSGMATLTTFTPRTTKPAAGNKYYIRAVSGGYNGAVQGSPTDASCNVLANCVGYANGRFNEIIGAGCCKYQLVCNAENFIESAQKMGLSVGQAPKLGAIMVWQKGASLAGADGAGHVCVVEEVISATQVKTSESGWGGSAFWNGTRDKGTNGNWGQATAYKFRGFIYNPAVSDATRLATATVKKMVGVTPTLPRLSKGSTGTAVKSLQEALNAKKFDCGTPDEDFGAKTDAALRAFQKAKGITVDGVAGNEVYSALYPME